GGAEHRLRPAPGPGAGGAGPRARAGDAGAGAHAAAGQPQAAPALRRPAPARGPGPGAGQAAQAAAARRAAGRAGQAPTRAHPVRAGEHPAAAGHHLHHGHPRPGGGDGHVLADRGDGHRAHRAGLHAGGAVRVSGHAVRGGVHRRHQPVRGAGDGDGRGHRRGPDPHRRAGWRTAGSDRRPAPGRHRGERGGAAGEDRRARGAARARHAGHRQRCGRHRARHRLPGRRVAVPGGDGERGHRAGAGDPRGAQLRAALRLGRHPVAHLGGGQRGGADVMSTARRGAGVWDFWFDVVRNLFGWFRIIGDEFRTRRGRFLVTALPMLWLGLFFMVPFLIVLKISFSQAVFGQVPPYTALMEQTADGAMSLRLHASNYAMLLSDPLYVSAYLKSLAFASVSTVFCLLLGYPIAYGIARAGPGTRMLLLVLVILPFWTSSLWRTYALIGILKVNGLLAQAPSAVGVPSPDFALLHTDIAVYIGIVYNLLP